MGAVGIKLLHPEFSFGVKLFWTGPIHRGHFLV